MVELASRVGGTLDSWCLQPWAYALWAYRQLQEMDRRAAWVARMSRVASAELMAIAFHEPKQMGAERRAAEFAAAATAAYSDRAALLEYGRRMVDDLARGRVLES